MGQKISNSTQWNEEGFDHLHHTKFAEKISDDLENLKFDKKEEIIWTQKGSALHNSGNYADAISAYDEALKIDPKLSITWNKKGNALSCLGKYEDAISAYDEALKLVPKEDNLSAIMQTQFLKIMRRSN